MKVEIEIHDNTLANILAYRLMSGNLDNDPESIIGWALFDAMNKAANEYKAIDGVSNNEVNKIISGANEIARKYQNLAFLSNQTMRQMIDELERWYDTEILNNV